MIRRGTSRTPPYILAVLVLIIIILGFNYWTLSSQNADLAQELEKLQSEIKISAMKQEQSEEKNAALQKTVHEMDTLASRLNKEIQSDKDSLKASSNEVQTLKYEITTLKKKIVNLDEQISNLNLQAEDCEGDLVKAKETNAHLQSERDDAVEAIAEKDASINSLKRQLEQAQDEAAAARREKMALAKPKIEPGMMNIPGVDQKEPYVGPGQLDYVSRRAVNTRDLGMQGINFHRDIPILPRDPPNVPRKKPRFSVADIAREAAVPQNNGAPSNLNGAGVLAPPQPVAQMNDNNIVADQQQLQAPGAPPVMERPAPPAAANNKPIQAPLVPEGPPPQNDVLAPPPQHLQALVDLKEKSISRGKRDNLDAAIDEEEKIVEDMMDDQDEEGNEIKQNNEMNDRDNIHEERKGPVKNGNMGALEVPQGFHADSFNREDINVDDDGNNQVNYYDINLENNIRNLGRPPDIH